MPGQFPAILIGLVGAGHQSWSANIFSTVSDMFPKSKADGPGLARDRIRGSPAPWPLDL